MRGPHDVNGRVQVLRETVTSLADEHIVVDSELPQMEFLYATSKSFSELFAWLE